MLALKVKTMRMFCLFFLKILFALPILLYKMLSRRTKTFPQIREYTRINCEELPILETECPEFQQIFSLSKNIVVGVEKVEQLPDETAIIRILTEKEVSKQYRKRVSRERGLEGRRFIKLNNQKMYLN